MNQNFNQQPLNGDQFFEIRTMPTTPRIQVNGGVSPDPLILPQQRGACAVRGCTRHVIGTIFCQQQGLEESCGLMSICLGHVPWATYTCPKCEKVLRLSLVHPIQSS